MSRIYATVNLDKMFKILKINKVLNSMKIARINTENFVTVPKRPLYKYRPKEGILTLIAN